MSALLDRTRIRNIVGLGLAVVVMLVLSSCGIGDDDSDPDVTATSDSGELSTQAEPDTSASLPPTTAEDSTPATSDGQLPGTPGGEEATPTPGIVVSAPPIAMPTITPSAQTPRATPSGGAATPQSVISSDVSVGDGTGGAVATAPGAENGSQPPLSGSPAASPVSDVITATTCEFSDSPPFTGDSAEQVTTVDVNFRAGPGQDCEMIGEPISAGVTVQQLSDPVQRDGDDEFLWVRVSIDGTEGWLTTELLEPVAGE